MAFITVVGFVGSAVPQKAPSPGSCDVSAIPAQIRMELRNKFAGWRPKQLSDMGPDDQKSWLQSPSGKSCPGIAIGHFESAKETSFALLLVPEAESTRGYRIVVLSNGSGEESRVSKLMDSADGDTSGLVISKAKPGTFADLESGKKIQIKLDGVIVEWLEKGAVLYYWSAGRYSRIVISD